MIKKQRKNIKRKNGKKFTQAGIILVIISNIISNIINRFEMFEELKKQKIIRRKEDKVYQEQLEEKMILDSVKQLKGDENFIKGVVDRMQEDSNRRKLGIDKKCRMDRTDKIEQSEQNKSNFNDDSSIKNFKKKIKKIKDDNYVFTVIIIINLTYL